MELLFWKINLNCSIALVLIVAVWEYIVEVVLSVTLKLISKLGWFTVTVKPFASLPNFRECNLFCVNWISLQQEIGGFT